MADKASEYGQILKDLKNQSPDISSIALFDTEGSVVCSIVPPSCDLETVGLIASSTIKMAENCIQQFRRKGIKQILTHGEQGVVVLRFIMDHLVLVVLAAKINKIFMDNVQNTANQLEDV
jgi:predicted regulator of Ras-like GTPase activity (Roadblock/LC7/MglB family)